MSVDPDAAMDPRQSEVESLNLTLKSLSEHPSGRPPPPRREFWLGDERKVERQRKRASICTREQLDVLPHRQSAVSAETELRTAADISASPRASASHGRNVALYRRLRPRALELASRSMSPDRSNMAVPVGVPLWWASRGLPDGATDASADAHFSLDEPGVFRKRNHDQSLRPRESTPADTGADGPDRLHEAALACNEVATGPPATAR